MVNLTLEDDFIPFRKTRCLLVFICVARGLTVPVAFRKMEARARISDSLRLTEIELDEELAVPKA
jgi:hypothetical protein